MKAAIALLLIGVALFLGWEVIRGKAQSLLAAAGNPIAQPQNTEQGIPKPGK